MNAIESERLRAIERPAGAAQQVHQMLRRAILESRFPAGEKLIETQLARMLNVSRTPVREALSKLEVEGLVDPAPAGGVVVRDIGAELAEIYGLRQRLEGYAAALAAGARTDAELAEIERVCELAASKLDDADLDERARLNNQFHMAITEASHSPRLVRLVSDYRDYFLNEKFLLFYDRETGEQQHLQHREIVTALRRCDAELAERLVRDHIQRALIVIQRGRKQSAK